MPGKRITIKLAEIYMQLRKDGYTQEVAAAKAGISERSGRSIEKGKWRGGKPKKRTYLTRKDPFEDVWESEMIPMLKSGIKQASFAFEVLQKKYPGKFIQSNLRTLQRKVKKWHKLNGPGKEVMFPQEHKPGAFALADFTHPDAIKVTINGKPFKHKLFHFRLAFSHFSYVEPFEGTGESFEKLSQGLANAFQTIGGVPQEQRTDSLSAAYKNAHKSAREDLTERYQEFLNHYGIKPSRNNPGVAHENGAVEASHRHIKMRIYQALIRRGSSNFESLLAYTLFLQTVTDEHNLRNSKNFELEQSMLQPLPETLPTIYSEVVAVVGVTSTIEVKRVRYTVPSKYIGDQLQVHMYLDRLECYSGADYAVTLMRIHPGRDRARNIDYRHVIEWLNKKPGAFKNLKYRNQLLPNDVYRRIWKHVETAMDRKNACKTMVGLLHLAATHDCESELAQVVIALIETNQPITLSELQFKFRKDKPTIPHFDVPQHNLSTYNNFIPNRAGDIYDKQHNVAHFTQETSVK